MQKTLASAVLCAACGAASASSVTLYGVVDTGLNYLYADSKDGSDSVSKTFSMASGQTAGSRFGLKGVEDIADGFKVGFVLENGFSSDDGKLKEGEAGKLFDREAQVYVDTTYGLLSFGRVGTLSSDTGSFGLMGGISAFGTGWGTLIGNQDLLFATKSARLDNVVTYVSPSQAGFKVYAQYGMGNTAAKDGEEFGTQVENKSSTDRYYALGASYEAANFSLYGLVDYVNKASWSDATNDSRMVHHGKDQYTFTLGGNVDFDVAKVYLGGQYFKNATYAGGEVDDTGFSLKSDGDHGTDDVSYGDLEGYGILAGTDVPVWGGTFKFSAGYMHAESDKGHKKANRWMAGAGYEYPISKRTNVYAGAGYLRDAADNTHPYAVEAALGLKHSF